MSSVSVASQLGCFIHCSREQIPLVVNRLNSSLSRMVSFGALPICWLITVLTFQGNISPSHTHKKKKRYSQQRKRQESVQDSAPQDFDGWVWEKLPLLASFVIQV
jgi:hypothetical protein